MTEKEFTKPLEEHRNGEANEMATRRDAKENSTSKVFCFRNSVLTDLMKLNHLQTVYNISVASCALLIITSVFYYIADTEKFWEDVTVMMWATSKLHIFAAVWIGLNMACIAVYQGFCIWAHSRHYFTKVMDFLFVLFFISACTLMFIVTPYNVRTREIPPITGFALLAEQVRMFMKIYSFVRDTFPKVRSLNLKKAVKWREEELHKLCPPVRHFLYYMFAPALLYRSSYPRNAAVNWRVVAVNFFNVFACIFITYCLFHVFITPIFKEVGLVAFPLPKLILIYAGCIVVGSSIMFLAFYLVLHSWLNAFAEMLRFGDRLFYTDWWNSTSFSQYYRRWNAVVYEWLYAYIYEEVQKFGFSRSLSALTVFIVSAVVHEYIICFALGFFFPALAIVYSLVGVPMMFITRSRTAQTWNTFMWALLFSGWGLLIMMYCLEWYSRRNCPPIDGASSYLPRFLTCGVLIPS